tara:strand:- start:1743 stop:2768 length:1026 start_codon:yes stop_codon:yes gene_type:complete
MENLPLQNVPNFEMPKDLGLPEKTKDITNITEKISDVGKTIASDIKDPIGSIKDTLDSMKDDNKGMFSDFGITSGVEESKEFLQSNNLVAKFSFIVFVLIVFVLIFRVFLMLMAYFMTPTKTPILIDGMIDARKRYVVDTDPNLPGAIPIYKSVNEEGGGEFSWSTWIYVDDVKNTSDKYRHIFHKGSEHINEEGIYEPLNSPGFYLKPDTNTLVLIMNSYDKVKEEIEVEEIPLHKWINIILTCENKKLDLYVNGTLVRRHYLESIPKQNYEKVYVALNGGFSGFISSLRYFDSVLTTYKIDEIVNRGPNLKMVDDSMTKTSPPYISTRWFFMENEKYDL